MITWKDDWNIKDEKPQSEVTDDNIITWKINLTVDNKIDDPA